MQFIMLHPLSKLYLFKGHKSLTWIAVLNSLQDLLYKILA